MKFTVEQVLDGIAGPTNFDNPIWNAWADMVGGRFIADSATYLKFGFIGWNERTIGQIVLDFHNGGLLEVPLTPVQIERAKANNWSGKTERQIKLFKKVWANEFPN